MIALIHLAHGVQKVQRGINMQPDIVSSFPEPEVPKPSNKKKLLIILSIVVPVVLIIAIVIVTTLLVTQNPPKESPTQRTIGATPTEEYVFNNMSDVIALPKLEKTPQATNGWAVDLDIKDASFSSYELKKESTNCKLLINTQYQASTDSALSDYKLSKQLAENIAAGDSINIDGRYVIKVKTTGSSATDSEADFYVITDNKSSLIAVRVINKIVYPSGDSVDSSSNSSMNTDGVIRFSGYVPSVVYKYQCEGTNFNAFDAVDLINQTTLNFNLPAETTKTTIQTEGK